VVIYTVVVTVAADSLPPVPTDDFQIGDRVLVGGTKPGIIVFIGEVHFSSGEWAGVVLDTPTGKNDGKIGGHRYFMCEPMRGVFCRLGKLAKLPGVGGTTPLMESGSTSRPSNAASTSPEDSRSAARLPKNDSSYSDVAASSSSKVAIADSKPPTVVVEKPASPCQSAGGAQQSDHVIPSPSAKAMSANYSNGDDHMIARFCSFLTSLLISILPVLQ